MFEQSGTFKNEFRKLGYEAYDYDILNDYGETDYQIDLFAEIEKAYDGEKSVFDDITQEDMILAFFPCTRFEAQILLWFRGESYQGNGYTDEKRLEDDIRLHRELHTNYILICKLTLVCLRRHIRMVFENPLSEQHYLTRYWCIKPKLIDKDRRDNGDYMKKPTQYWFIGCEPKNNLVFEPIEYVEQRRCSHITKKTTGRDRTVVRSEIHPQYANRFIRQYLIGEDKC